MYRAYKFRIYPNVKQQELCAKTFGCVRFIYNQMLGDKIEYYHQTGLNLDCYPSQYKSEYTWLKEVDSLALVGAYNHLKVAYKNFFSNPNVGFPKFKAKKYTRKSYTTNCVNGNIRLEKGKLVLPKLKAVKVKQHRVIPTDYLLKSVTVSQNPSGKYYASILFEYEQEIEIKELTTFVGLDFSMKELYVASDGTSAKYPRFYRQSLERLQREQRKLSHMKKDSNNRKKQRIRVAKLHERVSNQRKDFLHKQSRQITNAYDCVCIEDLNMLGMSQALNFGKSVADNGFGMFRDMLQYKLEEQGKQFVIIDKYFPSSKKCSNCGHEKEKLALSERTYVCEECGCVIDRDYNASINIRQEGMTKVYQ